MCWFCLCLCPAAAAQTKKLVQLHGNGNGECDLFMNLEQQPNVMDTVGTQMPCLIRRGTYYSCPSVNRWLLPWEPWLMFRSSVSMCRILGILG